MKGGEKMQETNKMRDMLVGEFSENYVTMKGKCLERF
jgi:hypothetical protein